MMSPAVYEKLLGRPGAIDAIGLYSFYVRQANMQHTIQPRAVASFCKKWLGFGADRFTSAHTTLEQLKVIKEIQKRDTENKFGKSYVRLLRYSRYPVFRVAAKECADVSITEKDGMAPTNQKWRLTRFPGNGKPGTKKAYIIKDKPKEQKLEEQNSSNGKRQEKPPIFDDGIKYVWDQEIGRYKHSVSGEVYIPWNSES